jgi:cytochrome c oxidase subunit IV
VSEHHIVSPKIYFIIFGVLMICTVLTVTAAEVDLNAYFRGLNVIVALTIAVFKASLVVLFFMHAKYSAKRTQLVIIASVFWLAIMLFMTMSDYVTRSWI